MRHSYKSIKRVGGGGQKKLLCILLVIAVILSSLGTNAIIAHADQTEWTFDYTKSVQTFTAPSTGKYYIDIYGAGSTGSTNTTYNAGGHTYGYINLLAGQQLYIVTGQHGVVNGAATYNGGGKGGNGATAGSGATSITTANRGELKNFETHKDEIVLVAGGSGGQGSAQSTGTVGNGGGSNGTGINHSGEKASYGHGSSGGTQSGGHKFGVGQNYCATKGNHDCGGYGGAGGGGLYGGTQSKCGDLPGGGGSGYINTDMVYNANTMASNHKGDGKATIKYIGYVYTDLIIDLNGHGSYNGQSGIVKINKKYGDTTTISNPTATDSFKFMGWKVEYGSVKPKTGSYTYDFNDSYITAQWANSMSVSQQVDVTAYNNKGGMNFQVTQLDTIDKFITIEQSTDGSNFYKVMQNNDSINPETDSVTISYAKRVQEFTPSKSGLYKLEVYGADSKKCTFGTEGITTSWSNSGGGKATGYKGLLTGDKIYIVTGGAGSTNDGGYNGGGNGGPLTKSLNPTGDIERYHAGGGGGGATHIATEVIGNGTLANYEDHKSSVLIVAGGAGGGNSFTAGGAGGGNEGGVGQFYTCGPEGFITNTLTVASQTNGYKFGRGQNGKARAHEQHGGGGGGWYGGGAYTGTNSYWSLKTGGNGGSGHLGNVLNGSMESGINKKKQGYAVISFVQEYINGSAIQNIYTPDLAAPNIPFNGEIEQADGTDDTIKLKVKWGVPNDNGTKYWHKIGTYMQDSDEALGLIPINEKVVSDTITTGVKGYHYYVDTNSVGTVTTANEFVEQPNITIDFVQEKRYMHVAAIDKAGNLGPTYTFEIPVAIIINYYGNDQTLNVYNETSSTNVSGKINEDMVLPSTVWTCKDNKTTPALGDTAYTKKGYKFAGWNLLSTAKIGTGTTSDQNGKQYTGTFIPVGTQLTYDQLLSEYGYELNLYAIWEPITYKIVYHGNGNWNDETVGTQKTSIHRYDHPQNLAPNPFTRNAGETWGSETQAQGYTFIGWGTSANKSTANFIDEEEVLNLTDIDNGTVDLYALWRKDIELTFNMQGGLYNNSSDEVKLKASVYNSQRTYTFDLLDGETASNLPLWTKQQGTIDAYGDFLADGNGINTKYIKASEDGNKIYRFLGWNTDPSSKTPLTNMIVYDRTGHITKYTTNHDETFYAIWEPILIVDIQAKRTLGDLFKQDGTKPKGEAHGVMAVTPEQTIEAVITSGEQGQYSITASGSGEYNITSTFDNKLTAIYKDGPTASWYDKLNEVNEGNKHELQDPNQQHSLNRHFTTHSNITTRDFYVPQYLGTDESYPSNKGVTEYNNEFLISQPSYYWQYVHNKDEIVKIKFNIFITSGQGGSSGGGGTIDPKPGDSTLRQFRTTILH